MFCKYCGKPLLEEADVCLKCGRFVDKAPTVKQEENVKPVAKTNAMSSAYIIAIIGFICALIPFASFIGFILSIISLCQYKVATKKDGRGLALAGLIISAIYVAFFLFAILYSILISL